MALEMSWQELVKRMTAAEVQEIMDEAAFHKSEPREYLLSHWAADIRRRVTERSKDAGNQHRSSPSSLD